MLGQAGQRGVHPGEVGGTAVGQRESCRSAGSGCELPAADGGRQQGLDRGRGAGGVDDVLDGGQRERPPRLPGRAGQQGDRVGFGAVVQAGDDVAELLAAGDPGGVQERRQADQRRGLGQPGGPQPAGVQGRQPAPAGQRPGQRVGDVAPLGLGRRRSGSSPRRTPLLPAAARGSGPAPALPAARGRRAPVTMTPPERAQTSVPRTLRRSERISPAPAPRQTSAVAREPPAGRGLGERPVPGSRRSPPQSKEPWPAGGAAARPPGPGAAPPRGR